MSVGEGARWAELTIQPTNMANGVFLGYTVGEHYESSYGSGIRTQAYSGIQAVYTSNSQGITGTDGSGHFSLKLDELTWLTRTGVLGGTYNNVTFKEVYVPIEVSTHYVDTLTGIQMGRIEAPKGWIHVIE